MLQMLWLLYNAYICSVELTLTFQYVELGVFQAQKSFVFIPGESPKSCNISTIVEKTSLYHFHFINSITVVENGMEQKLNLQKNYLQCVHFKNIEVYLFTDTKSIGNGGSPPPSPVTPTSKVDVIRWVNLPIDGGATPPDTPPGLTRSQSVRWVNLPVVEGTNCTTMSTQYYDYAQYGTQQHYGST